jgi:uncharacterized protein YdaU (DUF1376 family)
LSFAYLALYTGDYLRDTRHLTPLRHGVYLLLLMHCWDSRGPAPLDEQECAGIANCRSADEIEALRYILEKYFVRMDDGWYNHRMQAEVEKAQSISAARSKAGSKGYQAKAKHLLNKSQALVSTPPPPPYTTTTTNPNINTSGVSIALGVDGLKVYKNKKPTKASAQAPFVLPKQIPQEQWDAWIEARTRARKPPTDFAKRIAVSKLLALAEQGHHPAAVLAQSAFHGWSGLFELKKEA